MTWIHYSSSNCWLVEGQLALWGENRNDLAALGVLQTCTHEFEGSLFRVLVYIVQQSSAVSVEVMVKNVKFLRFHHALRGRAHLHSDWLFEKVSRVTGMSATRQVHIRCTSGTHQVHVRNLSGWFNTMISSLGSKYLFFVKKCKIICIPMKT